jgi:acyl dehydratase
MGLNKACLGKKYNPGIVFKVLKEPSPEIPFGTKTYALAYNDDNPWFLDESRPGGIIAPPMFGVVYSGPVVALTFFDEELNVNMPKLVHGEQDMYFHNVVRPGDEIRSEGEITEILEKETGEIYSVNVRSWNQKDELVLEAKYTFFIRGDKKGVKKEEKEETYPPPVFSQTMKLKDNQSLIYAEASGDRNPIHTDENFAKMVGLPGIILQGLCTMAIAQKAVIDEVLDRDPTRLKRLKVRFSKPVLNGDTLTTKGWIIEKKGNITVLGFIVENQNGVIVVKDGIAEVLK